VRGNKMGGDTVDVPTLFTGTTTCFDGFDALTEI
jgi:hypothetical protein